MANQSAINLFSSVVHDSAPPTATAINLYTSVVHNATPPTATAINLFSSVVHSQAQISGTLADITGTVNVSASFDGTVLGYSTSSVNFQWTWQTVPVGSSITNQAYPLPDGGVNTYFDMTDNQGLWHLNGTAEDSSGVGNNGSVVGSPSTVSGKIGQALSFNGSTDYIDIANDASLNSNVGTISVWIKFTSSGINQTIVAKNDPSASSNGWHLYIEGASDELRAQIKGSGTTTFSPSTGALNDGNWHHVVFVFESGGTSIIYLDGVEVIRDESTVTFTVSSQNLRIAKNVDTFWDEFNGTIDEFALWSRKLSDLEVNNLYFLQSGSVATDLVGNVGLGETFTFVPDVTGTFTTNLTVTNIQSSLSGNANAVISTAGPTPGPIITGSSPTVNLVESKNLGYVFNTYRIQNLSVQRSRTSEQVPFKLGTKGKQSLRLRTNTEFTGSS